MLTCPSSSIFPQFGNSSSNVYSELLSLFNCYILRKINGLLWEITLIIKRWMTPWVYPPKNFQPKNDKKKKRKERNYKNCFYEGCRNGSGESRVSARWETWGRAWQSERAEGEAKQDRRSPYLLAFGVSPLANVFRLDPHLGDIRSRVQRRREPVRDNWLPVSTYSFSTWWCISIALHAYTPFSAFDPFPFIKCRFLCVWMNSDKEQDLSSAFLLFFFLNFFKFTFSYS